MDLSTQMSTLNFENLLAEMPQNSRSVWVYVSELQVCLQLHENTKTHIF